MNGGGYLLTILYLQKAGICQNCRFAKPYPRVSSGMREKKQKTAWALLFLLNPFPTLMCLPFWRHPGACMVMENTKQTPSISTSGLSKATWRLWWGWGIMDRKPNQLHLIPPKAMRKYSLECFTLLRGSLPLGAHFPLPLTRWWRLCLRWCMRNQSMWLSNRSVWCKLSSSRSRLFFLITWNRRGWGD